MKKIVCIVLAIVLLYCAIQLLIPGYSLDVAPEDVTSVSLYYTNSGEKKEITAPTDIQQLISEINKQNDFGNYKEQYIDGGQGFIIVFHLTDESDFVCTYTDHSGGSGAFSNGTTNRRVSGLDLYEIWCELDYETKKEVYVE